MVLPIAYTFMRAHSWLLTLLKYDFDMHLVSDGNLIRNKIFIHHQALGYPSFFRCIQSYCYFRSRFVG